MTLADSNLLLTLANDLIGVKGIYQGREYLLIEVISSSSQQVGPSVVLEPVETDSVVQNTFQGEAKRFAQNNYTVPFFSEIKQDLHPVVAEFLGDDIVQVLREQIQ